ncbi:hypothetical protein [Spirochaeta lutea]|nr:hypothetical protein [Spirochaeta lutea]
MTLRVRNTILYCIAAAVFGVAVSLIALAPRIVSLFQVLSLSERVLLFSRSFGEWRVYQTQLSVVLLSMVAPLLVSVLGYLGFLRFFRKITGPLIFFFFIFLGSLVFETLPIWTLLARMNREPLGLIAGLTRLHTFGLILGGAALFTAGLYTAGVKYQYQGGALIITLGVAGGLSYLLPVDVSVMASNFLAKAGLSSIVSLVLVFLMAATLLNFFKSSLMNQSPGDMVYGFSVVGMMAGRWMIHSSPNVWMLVVGVVLLITGSVVYARRVFRAYLWY